MGAILAALGKLAMILGSVAAIIYAVRNLGGSFNREEPRRRPPPEQPKTYEHDWDEREREQE